MAAAPSTANFWDRRRRVGANQRGALIIVIIVTITIFAILGAGMLYLGSSSSFAELFTNNRGKAYYLALSGIEYAAPIVTAANNAGQAAPITNLDNQTYTLSDGGKFYLRTDNTNASYTLVESTGIVNQGSLFQTQQKVSFNIAKSVTSSTVASGGFQTNFAQDWSDTQGTVKHVDASGVEFQGTQSLIAMTWAGNTNLPDLATMRTANDGLLSYRLQLKLNMNVSGSNGTTYLTGLSFRLNMSNNTWYGLSFYKRESGETTSWTGNLDSSWNGLTYSGATKVYLVLWEKTAAQWHVINSTLLTNASFPNIIDTNGELIPWSIIAVDVLEGFVGGGSSRTNYITAYLNSANNLPVGTSSFAYTTYNFSKITWATYPGIAAWSASSIYALNDRVIPPTANGHNYLCALAGTSGASQPTWPTDSAAIVTDGTVAWQESTANVNADLTTQTFSNPNEIGLHIYYDSNAANKQFINDFAFQGINDGSTNGITGGVAY